jgi:hypothetical protein
MRHEARGKGRAGGEESSHTHAPTFAPIDRYVASLHQYASDGDPDGEGDEDEEEEEEMEMAAEELQGTRGPGNVDEAGDEDDETEMATVLSPKDLLEAQFKAIEEVNQVFQIPAATARHLLAFFGWNKERLMERYAAAAPLPDQPCT